MATVFQIIGKFCRVFCDKNPTTNEVTANQEGPNKILCFEIWTFWRMLFNHIFLPVTHVHPLKHIYLFFIFLFLA